MAIKFEDIFNRADEALGASPNWDTNDATGSGTHVTNIVGNEVISSTNGVSNHFLRPQVTADTDDQITSAIVRMDKTGSPSLLATITLSVRGSVPSVDMGGFRNSYITFLQSNGTTKAFRVLGGVFTQLGSDTSGNFVLKTTNQLFKLKANGTTITVDLGGSQVFNITDSGVISGKLGISQMAPTFSDSSNLINLVMDDFVFQDVSFVASAGTKQATQRDAMNAQTSHTFMTIFS